jgi:trimeric autotransporter adhesin
MAVDWGATYKTTPLGSDSPTEGDDQIRNLKVAVQERMTNAHYTVDDTESAGTSGQDWWHKMGSAKVWYQAAAPTTRVEGSTTALDSDDVGRIWIDSDDGALYVCDGTDFATEILGVNTYVDISTNQAAIAGNKTWTGTSTFSGAVSLTSTLTGGSSTNITINTDKFTVNGGTGVTAIGGTLNVVSNLTVATDKFIVSAANGSTTIGDTGTLTVAGLITATSGVSGNLTGNVTGNVSGTAATVTGATQANISTVANVVTVGALDSGSITSGFGSIDNGASAITTTGTITAGLLAVDNIQINGNAITSTAGTDLTITPLAGQQLILDGHWQIDGATLTAITDNDTVINAYAGKNVTIESVTFDNNVVTATTFDGALTGNADTATLAATVAVTETNDTTAYIALVGSGTGSLTVHTSGAGLTYDASSGALSGDSFSGVAATFSTSLTLFAGTPLTGLAISSTGAGDGTATYDVILPTQAYVDKEIDSVIAGGVNAASEGTSGIAELATQAETDTGTDDLRIVTPLKLKTNLASPPAIGGTAPSTAVFTTLDITSFAGNWTNAARTVADMGILTTVDINGGTADGVTIGGSTAGAGTFTDLTSTGNTTIGNATGDALTFHPSAWTLTNAVTITGTWTDLGIVSTVDINGGTVDATIGGTTPAAGTFTTVTGNTSVVTDTIAERTATAGVTIDGVLLKDTSISFDAGTTKLACKVVDIGDWNIDADSSKSVAHGLTWTDIRTITFIIRNDADSSRYPAPRSDDLSITSIEATYVILSGGGPFNATSFDSTSYNRGWVTIWYEV